MTIPVLRSARLTLRGFAAEDHRHLLALAQDPRVGGFLHEGPPPSAEEVTARMTRAHAHWARHGYGMFAVEDEEGFAGRLGFFHPDGHEDPRLVYALAHRCWGRGYAAEGARLALGWLGQAHGARWVVATIDPANPASARVAEKLGGSRAGKVLWAGAELNLWVMPDPPAAAGPGGPQDSG